MQKNDLIVVTVTWISTAFPKTDYDFDLFLYKNGVNLLSTDSSIKSQIDAGINPLTYTITENGTYLLEVSEYGK